MKKLIHISFALLLILNANVLYAQEYLRSYIEAPYDYNIRKQSYKKRFGDITTSGRFLILNLTFINKDSLEHAIDYPCFYLTDTTGAIYEVHADASIVRQTRFEDWKVKDVDTIGFNHKTIKPNFKIRGVLVFEVPSKGDYELKFRGYLL